MRNRSWHLLSCYILYIHIYKTHNQTWQRHMQRDAEPVHQLKLWAVTLPRHASIVAQCSAVRLLTQFVRLPIPTWQASLSWVAKGVTELSIVVQSLRRFGALLGPMTFDLSSFSRHLFVPHFCRRFRTWEPLRRGLERLLNHMFAKENHENHKLSWLQSEV